MHLPLSIESWMVIFMLDSHLKLLPRSLGMTLLFLQSDDDCCNSCEDVREAYRKKGWAISNPDLIDQVFIVVW